MRSHAHSTRARCEVNKYDIPSNAHKTFNAGSAHMAERVQLAHKICGSHANECITQTHLCAFVAIVFPSLASVNTQRTDDDMRVIALVLFMLVACLRTLHTCTPPYDAGCCFRASEGWLNIPTDVSVQCT